MRRSIEKVRRGPAADAAKRDESLAYWRDRPAAEKFAMVGRLVTAAYAMKGIDVSQRRLQRSRPDPAEE